MSSDNSYNPIEDNLDKLPPLLYKYRTFDDKGYGIAMASKGEVFFASARDFNDPFENYFIPQSDFTDLPEDELVEYIELKTEQHFPHASLFKRRQLEATALKRAKKHREDPSIAPEKMLELQYQKFGILSLAKKCDSLPMWAYYSNNHEGMCIGLKTNELAKHQKYILKEKDELIVLYDVNYTSEIPRINIDLPLDGDMSDEEFKEEETVHHTKSEHWEHEEEIRLIYWDHPNHVYKLGQEAIGEILLGINVNDNDVEDLINNLIEAGSGATVKQAKKSTHNYGLEFEEIDY